jgi:hypothetical protein
MKNLQGNEVDKVLTDVQGNQMIFKAVDDLDNGVNGTAGMRYTITGDGKFQSSEKRLRFRVSTVTWVRISNEYFKILWHRPTALSFPDLTGEQQMRAKCTENFRYFIINKRATNS